MAEDDGEGEQKKGAAELIPRKSEPSNRWATFNRDLMAGAVMGGAVHTIVAPIERAKLLLQTQESNISILSGPHRRFKGMLDCIRSIVKEEGVISLWRGNGSSVLRYYPSVALNFSLKVSYSCHSYFNSIFVMSTFHWNLPLLLLNWLFCEEISIVCL